MISLETSLENLPKIGPAYQKRLKKMGLATVRDLLLYFPSRYDDFSNVIPIEEIKTGETVCVQGRISTVEHRKSFRKWMDIIEIIVEDQTGFVKATWFNQPYLEKTFKEGDTVFLAGKVSLGQEGLYLNNPSYEKTTGPEDNLTHTGRIVPVYPETRGVTSRWLRFIIKPLLAQLYNTFPEILP